jgi:hypothetical protein
MAIVQISRIQHRRGYEENLPQLSHAEFGWVTDKRQLWIGNGPISEGAPELGNTQVLTEYSNISALITHIYEGNTGTLPQTNSFSSSPIVRSIQDRLDDYVSVLAFGAIGDGTVDDTDAINRAIRQLYINDISQKARRTLYFPAGLYLVSGTIFLPPWATLVGDGSEKTYIQYGNSQTIATGDAVLTSGQVTSITITNPGLNYKTPPTVTIAGNGVDAEAIAEIDDLTGEVTEIIVTNIGSGYTTATVTITTTAAGGHDATVLKTMDSLSQTGVNIGLVGAVRPNNIFVGGMTFKSSDRNEPIMDVAQLDSISDSIFYDVGFCGAYDNGDGLPGSTRPAGVLLSQTSASPTENLTFQNCCFKDVHIGIYANDDVDGIRIQNTSFQNLFKGIWLGETTSIGTGPTDFKVTGSIFKSIDHEGIDIDWSTRGVYSSHNTFFNVGNNNAGDGIGSVVTDVINFGATNVSGCASIGDTFYRPDSDLINVDRVEANNTDAYIVIPNKEIRFGKLENRIPVTGLLLNNVSASTGMSFDESTEQVVRIRYKLTRGTEYRVGVLMLSIKAGAPVLSDEYNETGVTGITFSAVSAAGVTTIDYTATDAGSTSTLTTTEEIIY